MDIYCGRCGEPWDMDSLHEMWDENLDRLLSYDEAIARFRSYGCGAWEGERTVCAIDPTSTAALIAQAAMELSDYADDWASDCDDLLYVFGG